MGGIRGRRWALIDALRGSQLAGLIYTAVDRDGMLQGPDLTGGIAAADASALPVLFSGGVSSEADLAAIAATGAAAGAIVGTAIYERRVDLEKRDRRAAARRRHGAVGGVTAAAAGGVRPLVVISRGVVVDLLAMNERAYVKTRESRSLWVTDAGGARELPYRPPHDGTTRIVNVQRGDSWYAVELAAENAAEGCAGGHATPKPERAAREPDAPWTPWRRPSANARGPTRTAPTPLICSIRAPTRSGRRSVRKRSR